VFRKADFKNAARPFPDYLEGKLLIVEFMRGWIMSVTMDKDGNCKSMEQFLPQQNFSSAIDMKFGPDGDLFVLEYGSAWFRGNENAQLVKIEYNGGNRKPFAVASADKVAGAVPLTVNLSSHGTIDYDPYDSSSLTYSWNIKSDKGHSRSLEGSSPSVTLDSAGTYTVEFTVTDSKGEKNSRTLEIKAGNEPPVVQLDIVSGNRSFFFAGSPIQYKVNVEDKEDGSVISKGIGPDEVALNFDYVPEGYDPIEIAQNHRASDEWASFSAGQILIGKNDCKSCHIIDKKSVGPSYQDIARKYKRDREGQERIAAKIISGGSGVWGDHAMSAHPQLSGQDAMTMVKYIVSLGDEKTTEVRLPLNGMLTPTIPKGESGKGGYLLRAAYRDKGTKYLGSLSAERIIALRNPVLDPEKADTSKGVLLMTTPRRSLNMVGTDSYLAYKGLDMTGIKSVEFMVQAPLRSGSAGGTIEIHMDSPNGKILGQSEVIKPKDVDFRRLMAPNPPSNTGAAAKASQPAPPPPDFATRMRMVSTIADIPVAPVTGPHDIYFVFRNPAAAANQILIQVNQIEFKQIHETRP
jgi:cytochrome c